MRRTNAREEPFFSATAHAIAEPFELPTLHGTLVYSLLEESDPKSASALDALNERALDEILTRFPFAPEALHSRLRTDPGPVAASLAFTATRAGGGAVDSTVVTAALGVELLGMFPSFLRQTVDRPVGEGSKLNNIFAILLADYVVSRSLRAGATGGEAIARAIGKTSCSMCEAEMIERDHRGDADCSAGRYLRAAELREGALFQLAASVSSTLGDHDSETGAALARFGAALGVAHRIAEDTCALFTADARGREEADRTLREGLLTLPMIEAISAGDLEPEMIERDAGASLSAIRHSQGVGRALAECEARTRVACDALRAPGLDGGMKALAGLPAKRIRVALSAFEDPPQTSLATVR
jgi:hypothetical protein